MTRQAVTTTHVIAWGWKERDTHGCHREYAQQHEHARLEDAMTHRDRLTRWQWIDPDFHLDPWVGSVISYQTDGTTRTVGGTVRRDSQGQKVDVLEVRQRLKALLTGFGNLPQDEDYCTMCGKPADYYLPDGTPWCQHHYAETAEGRDMDVPL